ncbi:hypothetical protein J6590_030231 [Homalodisca vitripennis]|nr:hypothetical protein J6590_030231 [Homalodisca vitripennis]
MPGDAGTGCLPLDPWRYTHAQSTSGVSQVIRASRRSNRSRPLFLKLPVDISATGDSDSVGGSRDNTEAKNQRYQHECPLPA